MIIDQPYPFAHATPDQIQALIRKAHAERSQAVRDLFLALFHRKPATRKAEANRTLAAASCL